MAYSDLRKIAFVGDYPPRKCGIATFYPRSPQRGGPICPVRMYCRSGG